MKTIKYTIAILVLLFSTNLEAQFLKKLGEVAQKAAERTLERKVEEKVEEKVSEKTDEATDKVFDKFEKKQKTPKGTDEIDEYEDTAKLEDEISSGKLFGNIFGEKTPPAGSYSFSHSYVLEVTSSGGPMTLEYLLKNDVNYMGTSLKEGEKGMVSVIDMERNQMYMFMENEGSKTLMSLKLDFDEMVEEANDEQEVSVTKTGRTKNILGYRCLEYKASGKDFTSTIWVTPDAGISFPKNMGSLKKKKGDNSAQINQVWVESLNGLIMEMVTIDTSKRKPETIKMLCTKLEKVNYNLKTAGYKSMF